MVLLGVSRQLLRGVHQNQYDSLNQFYSQYLFQGSPSQDLVWFQYEISVFYYRRVLRQFSHLLHPEDALDQSDEELHQHLGVMRMPEH